MGPIPVQDYYMPEAMSPEARQEFEKWHQEQQNNQVVFDFQQELVAYCESDVRLLKEPGTITDCVSKPWINTVMKTWKLTT